jgi:predicted PurR-regulated permease PerM
LFLVFFLVLLAVALVIPLARQTLDLADRLREILRQIGLDIIHIWSSAYHAALEIDRERSKLEIAQEYAQIKLTHEKQRLLLPPERK